jgi:hypothetical protein
VLFAGAGSGSAGLGAAADEAGLGSGTTGWLALGLGWVLGNGVVLAEARRTASARSTGMPAGCWARPLIWLAVRPMGSVLGSIRPAFFLGAGLAGAEVVQALVAAARVACTPVSIMLAAP